MLVHRKLWALMGSIEEERLQVTRTMCEPTEEGRNLRSRVRELMEQTDDEFNALGIQMNQRYIDSPLTVIEDGDIAPSLQGVNLVKEQVTSTFPGYHLPHVWLAKDGQSERLSTLDLVGAGCFTVLTGIGGGKWKDAARAITSAGGVPVNAFSIGVGQDYMDAYWGWQDVRGVEEDGAVLVRPDHFVCWRCKHMPSDPQEKLHRVLEKLLWHR